MNYIQDYNPLNNMALSALVAIAPIALFFICLVWLKLKGHIAALLTAILAFLVAVFIYKMPAFDTASSFVYGFWFGLWPISWIIIAAIFLYKISVKSGYFDILRDSITSITPDQRLQAVLIAFCFGAFLEGAIGFGGPVAITAAILVGLGFRPLYAAGLCLVSNAAPAAFGAVGIPVIALSKVVGEDATRLASMVSLISSIFILAIPFLLVFFMNGLRGVRETWPAVLVAGLTYMICNFLVATFIGPELPDIVSPIVSIASLALFLKFIWQPKNIFTFDADSSESKSSADSKQTLEVREHSFGKILLAWSPFLILIALIVVWTSSPFKALFEKGGFLEFSVLHVHFESLSHIYQAPPVVPENTPVKSVFSMPLISTLGTSILITALITIALFKVRPKVALNLFGETLNEMKYPILTIGLVLGFAYISNYSGMSATLGLAFASTGSVFSFFSPVVGWIGVFLTGSVTSSGLLFGGLQKVTAGALGIPEVIFLAANTLGSMAGKMISPQSIAVACAAVGLVGKESEVFRVTIKYSGIAIVLIGLLIAFISFVMPWIANLV